MHKYGLFDIFFIVGMGAILLGGAIAFLLQTNHTLSEKIAFLGVWVIFSFLIMVGVEGNARGIPRHKVGVPLKPAVFSFTLAFILFIVAGLISVT